MEIQDVFSKIREMKKEQKDIKDMYKDALAQADKYEEVVEEIKKLREEKKAIETRIQGELGRSWEKFEELKFEMEGQKEMMNDLALTTLMKGQTVAVKDEFDNAYEPIWKVNFKKTNLGQTAE
jgi:predicted nuclease with TOPRIM domain